NQWGFIQSDDRKSLVGGLNFSWFRDGHGAWQRDLSPSLTFRPSSALLVSAGIGYNRNHSQSQWVANLTDDTGAHYVFGRLNQTTVRLTARVNYTITPRLTVQIYAQPFISAGDYSGFKELADGHSKSYDDR